MLSDIIVNEEDNLEILYFCHTTKWENFEKILESGVLQIDYSKFPPNSQNKEDGVVYLFYGIPLYTYKVAPNTISANYTYDLPICILFKSDIVNTLSRFYPFDTGAAFNNMYKSFRKEIKSPENIADYCVKIQNEGRPLRQFVKRYFGTNEYYCLCRPQNREACSEEEEELLMHYKTYGGDSKLDQRSTAIEVHSKHDIEINANNVEALIVPRYKSNRFGLINKIKEQFPGIEILTYNDINRIGPDTYRYIFIDSTIKRYSERKKI